MKEENISVRQLLGRLGLTFASLLLVAFTVELGVRVTVAPEQWQFRDGTNDWRTDATLGWVNRADLDVTSRSGDKLIRFRTNPDGLIPSTASRERGPGTLRVMVFGDSMVVGRDVPQDAIYTARLEQRLREGGLQVDVVNAGVLGYSTDQALLAMERWLPEYRPDVTLYGSTLNDFGGNRVERANNQGKPRFHLEASGNLRLEPPVVEREIRRLGGGPRTWIQSSAAYRLLQPRIFLLRARLSGSDQRILLGDMQELYVSEEARDQVDWDLYAALVARMQAVAAENGSRFLFFAHPEVGEVWEPYIEAACERLGVSRSDYDPHAIETRVAELAKRTSVAFAPLIDDFRAATERGPFHLLPYDAHLSEAGHALLAERLADVVAPLLAQARGAGSAR